MFRSKEQLSQLDEQKKGVVVNPESRPERKKVVKQTNGAIVINSILGKLELFNESVIEGKDMSVEVKLGSQIKES